MLNLDTSGDLGLPRKKKTVPLAAGAGAGVASHGFERMPNGLSVAKRLVLTIGLE